MLIRSAAPLSRRRPLQRALLGGGAALVAVAGSVLLAGPASAHVSVNPREAAPGGFAKLTFRVPTESPTASTTKVTVSLPLETPLASVSIKPHPGWTANVTKTKLATPVVSEDLRLTEAVSRITWTARKGAAIAPGQFEEFDISVGPLPTNVPTMSFPAVQTYDDGTTVRWTDTVTAGSQEPEHPAPTLTLAEGENQPASPTTASANPAPGTQPVSQASATDGTARALGTAGLVVGGLGLLAGAAGLGAARRRGA
jgi:periplasmic copper chaperone A